MLLSSKAILSISCTSHAVLLNAKLNIMQTQRFCKIDTTKEQIELAQTKINTHCDTTKRVMTAVVQQKCHVMQLALLIGQDGVDNVSCQNNKHVRT
jgi:hypothetical protein